MPRLSTVHAPTLGNWPTTAIMATMVVMAGPNGTADRRDPYAMAATMDGPVWLQGPSKPLVPSHMYEVDDGSPPPTVQQSLWATTLSITTLCGVTFASSMTTGLLGIALPAMARELSMSDGLLLWPASIYGQVYRVGSSLGAQGCGHCFADQISASLTCGCSLLLAGSIADILGSRNVYIAGCLLLTGFVLGSGLAQTVTQLIVFRAGQGIAAAMCLPTAISLLASSLSVGKRRNIGFAVAGASQSMGYSAGLFLGGFFVDSIGWRYGWYMSAAVSFMVFLAAFFGISKAPRGAFLPRSGTWQRLAYDIDWVGAMLASACFGLLSYVLAVVSNDSQEIKNPTQIASLCVAGACLAAFFLWAQRQEKRGSPALIPNSLWKERAFSSLCLMVFLTWAVTLSLEVLFSLFFQEVQGFSAIEASLRFLPNVMIGVVQTLAVGLVLHRTSPFWVLLVSCALTALSPLLMAVNDPRWTYWYAGFWAVLLSAISGDILFVVSPLVVTASFPDDQQALAGAVFNTVAQFGGSVGLAAVALISSAVTKEAQAPALLLEGYRACFWFLFGAALLACVAGLLGLRRMSTKGMK